MERRLIAVSSIVLVCLSLIAGNVQAQTAPLAVVGTINGGGDSPGDTISYAFEIKNTGGVFITNLDVTTDINVAISGSPISRLPPGAVDDSSITGLYVITQADLDAGDVNMLATLKGEIGGDPPASTLAFVGDIQILSQNHSIQLTKVGVLDDGGDGFADVGDTINYTVTALNTGNVTLTDVTITDPMFSCSSGPLNPFSSLAPGASASCDGVYTLTQADLTAGQVDNTATVTSNEEVGDSASETVILPLRSPSISLSKTGALDDGGDGFADVGDTINYTVTALNTGNVTLTDVTITDPMFSCSSGPLNPFSSLAPGASASCDGVYTLTQADLTAGQVDNTATVTSNEEVGDSASETVILPLRPPASFSLTKTSSTGLITAAGQVVPYTYVITNTGEVTLTGVALADSKTDDPPVCDPAQPATLAAGATMTCTAQHTVTQAELDAGGNLSNIATADSSETPPSRATLDIPIQESGAELSVAKTSSTSLITAAGQVVAYTYVVTNTGNVTLNGVTLTDNNTDAPPACNPAQPATLAPGAEVNCTAQHTVTQAEWDAGGNLSNIATADSSETPSSQDTLDIPIQGPSAELSVAKTSSTSLITAAGQVVPYTYVVTNTGNVALNGVTLTDNNTDDPPVCTPAQPATLAPGAEMNCTAQRTVTQAELDAGGNLSNIATADSSETPSSQDTLDIPIQESGAELSVAKTSSTSLITAAGQVVPYTYVVTNTGNVTLNGVTLTDNNTDAPPACNPAQPATLAPGAEMNCTAQHTVTQAELDAGGNLSNTATTDSSETPPSRATLDIPIKSPPGETTFTVIKDFSDDNPAAVQVTLTCTDAAIDQATKPASEANPAVFELSEVAASNSCTATETVPDGYTPDESGCAGKAAGPESSNSCQIINTASVVTTFTVFKDFSDDNTDEVEVTLTCTGATIEQATLPASEDSPAVFKLSVEAESNTCTATETVPDGYTPDETDCAEVAAPQNSSNSCEITNTPDKLDNPFPDDLDPNQNEIGEIIFDTCSTNSAAPPEGRNAADFQTLCTGLVVAGINKTDVEEALKQATPDDVAAVRTSGMQTNNIQVTAVDGRIGTLRGGGGAGFSASGFSMKYGDLALSSSLIKSFISAYDQNNPAFMQANLNQNDDGTVLNEFGRWGAWISGRIIFGEKDPTTNQIAYDFDTAGITFGLDYRFTDEFVAGLAVGYANTDAEVGVNDGEIDTRGYSVSLYGTWFKSDRFYLGGSLGYGSNDYDQTRNVRYKIAKPELPPGLVVPDWAFDVDQTLAAEYDGDQFSIALSGGWDFYHEGWTFGPTLRIDYAEVNIDAYDEILVNSNIAQAFETDGWAVHINEQTYKSLQPALGFEFSNAISRSWGVFIPQGYIDIVTELEDGGVLVTGTFLGDRNKQGTFTLLTDNFEETFVRAGLGFGMVLKNNKSAFLMVDGDFGRDLLTTYYINAGFRWQF